MSHEPADNARVRNASRPTGLKTGVLGEKTPLKLTPPPQPIVMTEVDGDPRRPALTPPVVALVSRVGAPLPGGSSWTADPLRRRSPARSASVRAFGCR